MNRYLEVVKISIAQELVYKFNFFIFRIRNIIQILVFFFLWTSVFSNNDINYFGYNREKIIAYTFLLILIRAIVMTSKSTDVSGIISSGELSNYLLKPINYFRFLITRDLSSKLLHISFSIFEVMILVILLKPTIFIQSNIILLLLFIVSLIIAAFIFFNIVMIANSVPFWMPELGWGAQFLIIIIFAEFLSGAFFPLDIFPPSILAFLKLTPFPYLIFIPIKTYLGDESIIEIVKSLLIGTLWSIILWLLMNKLWKKGLKVYEAVGR